MRRLLCAVAAVAGCVAVGRGEEPTPRGPVTPAAHTFARAGFPEVIAPWARPARTPDKAPGYIGGSVALGGGPPVRRIDGVFGYDYVGPGPYGREFLGWTHSPVYPVMGSYWANGPRVFDIFSIRPLRRALSPGETEE